MSEPVGSIYYEVDGRTEGLLRAQRQVDSSSRSMERSLGRSEKASTRLGGSFDNTGVAGFRLKTIVTSISAALSARQIISYSDAWTRTQNQLRQVTSSSQQLAEVNRELLEISNRSAIQIDNTADLYTKVARATSDLGLQQQTLTRFIDLTSKSLRANGASSQGASALILQLSQSFNAGILRGQEFNTIMDQAPLLLDALREATGKSTTELIKLGGEGKLSTDILIKAVLKYSRTIDKEAAKATNSFSDSMTIARNNMISFIGSSDSAQGVIGKLGQGMVYLSNNLDSVAQGAIGLAAIISGRYASALGAGAIAHLSVAASSLRQAAADREAAQAATVAAAANLRKAQTATVAVKSTISEIEAERAYVAAALASATTTGQQVAIKRQLAEMDAALTAAKQRLTVAQQQEAAAAYAARNANAANNAVMRSTGIVARTATGAMAGLKSVMALLGGPVGVILLAAQALYAFREELGLTKGAATSTQQALKKLKNEMQDMAGVELDKTQSELEQQLSALQQGIENTENQINQMVASGDQDFGGSTIADMRRQLESLREDAKQTKSAIDAVKELRNQSTSDDNDDNGDGGGIDLPSTPDKSFDRVKQQLESERETIDREYAERNKIIKAHTTAGSAQQESLLKRSGDLRAREMQSLNDRLAGINATGIQQINQQYDEQHQEILDTTKAGSDQQMEALIKNQAARQKALKEYHDQELGDLRSATAQVESEYAKRRQRVLENTRMGGQEQRDMLLKVEQQKQVDLLNAQAEELAAVANHQQALKDAELAYQTARIQQLTGFTQQAAAKLAEFQQNAAEPMKFLGDSLTESFVNLDDTISSTFVNAMSRGEGLNDILGEIGRTVLASLLQSFIKLGVQMAVNAAMGSAFQAAQVAQATAGGAAVQRAWEPAAITASIATLGAAAGIGALAYQTALAVGAGSAQSYDGGGWASSATSSGSGRAHGGPVSAGMMRPVGEGGKPEIFNDGTRSYLLPGSNGEVFSNRDIMGAQAYLSPGASSKSRSGASGITSNSHVTFNIQGNPDEDMLEQMRQMAADAAEDGARRGYRLVQEDIQNNDWIGQHVN